MAREYGEPLKEYTPLVYTLYYRAPELLLGAKIYSPAVDMWAIGCIMAEFVTMQVLWPGQGEIDQLNRIFALLGTPNDRIWPGYSNLPAVQIARFTPRPYSQLRGRFSEHLSEKGCDLLLALLTYDPEKRISAAGALNHSWFNESPRMKETLWMPSFKDLRVNQN
jgi:cell division cycle 2-like protein